MAKIELKPTDLRTGNVLHYKTDEGTFITEIDWQDLKWLSENPKDFIAYHKPIPITKKILKKLGFEWSGSEWILPYYEIGIRLLDRAGYVYLNGCDGGQLMKYTHQLQNLVHALTGKDIDTDQLINHLK